MVFVLCLVWPVLLVAEHPDSAFIHIQKRLPLFKNAAVLLDVDCRTLCSTVCTERLLNYDWKDLALDVLLAQSGWNSSIGLCQVELKTAYWIEVQLDDSRSKFYPGNK